MKYRALLVGVAALALALPAIAFSADSDPAPASRPAGERPFGGRDGGPGGGPMNGVLMGQDPLIQALTVVGLADLQPDFNLTKDQKTKIQSIHDDYKKQLDDWRKDKADDIKKLQDEAVQAFQNMGQGGGGGGGADGGGREAIQKIMQERSDLVGTAPKTDDAIAAIKAVLTDDQNKAVEALKDQMAQQRDEAMKAFGGRFGPGGGRGFRGGQRGGGGGGDNGGANNGGNAN